MPVEGSKLVSSVLTQVKGYLGITEEQEAFDQTLVVDINTALAGLRQLGVEGSVRSITSDSETWSDVCGDAAVDAAKSYVDLRVRLLFDPPQSSAHVQAINEQIDELEWRIVTEVEHGI